MSSAFLKNETADGPVVIPARAPLPPGVANYVTPRGLALLRAELIELETERAHKQTDQTDETERTRQLALLNGRIANLNQRIASAKVVNGHEQPLDPAAPEVVRFGATVNLRPAQTTGQNQPARSKKTIDVLPAERQFTIVGVDEANAIHGLIAFTAPLAQAMQGKRVGEQIAMRNRQGEDLLEIVSITYEKLGTL